MSVGAALGRDLDQVGRMPFAELVAWKSWMTRQEDREIARQAAAIARFWTGDNTWTADHYINSRGISPEDAEAFFARGR